MVAAGFLSDDAVRRAVSAHGTPLYIYDEASLVAQAEAALSFPAPFGLSVRYAMKACPSRGVLNTLHGAGLVIDASSGYEAERAIRAGIPPQDIQITAQQIPDDLPGLLSQGVLYNACSLHQLKKFAEAAPGGEVSIRVNPGLGSGHSKRTNTGGPSSSFGIWHEYIGDALAIARDGGVRITGMHTHIGSGSDPGVWTHCAGLALDAAAKLPDVTRLSLGGGFKVGRMPGEASADIAEIGREVAPKIEAFAMTHGRELHIELEPGTFLTANAGALIARVIDVVDTGPDGFRFIKIDAGMAEILRPSMYGAQHPLRIVGASDAPGEDAAFVVAGHCCESGDILTPEAGNPEALEPRVLPTPAIGDYMVVGGAGAYCAAMPAGNYNSFPLSPEILQTTAGDLRLIRQRQMLDQILENENAVMATAEER